MAIGLIGWGRFLNVNQGRVTVPPGLWTYLHSIAAEIGQSFDFLQTPPPSLCQGGAGPGDDGYGVFWLRQLDGTRYGSCEDLLAMIAALNTHGVQTLLDLVLHQMVGENGGPGVFKYPGADNKTMNGAGSTKPSWFRGSPNPPWAQNDTVPGGPLDPGFGRPRSYQHSQESLDDAIAFVKWLTHLTDATGYRFDDVKGSYPPAVREIMNAVPQCSFYSEFFDNRWNMGTWATNSPMNSRSAVEDFDLHWHLQAACNGYDARQFVAGGAGYWQMNPGLSVGFVDNPDTDTTPGQQVIFNKAIAYAILMSLPLAKTLVYGKDYFPSSVWPGSYGLKRLIDNLCWINRKFAFGTCEIPYVDQDVLIITRGGDGGSMGWSGGMVTVVNFNTLTERSFWAPTPCGPNRLLHDYTGHLPDVWTNADGWANFTVHSNAYSSGTSYGIYAPAGVGDAHPTQRRQTTQVFVGDPTLRIMPVKNGRQVLPQRIYCQKDTDLRLHLQFDRTGNSGQATVQMEAAGPKDVLEVLSLSGPPSSAIAVAKVNTTGWHTISLIGALLPASGINFTLTVTYTGAV
ncbi:alpha-amylase domain-containing protein [Granulicella arctica]|uniref:alpha-amylase domain-containing protein n=1 Tax=Granulicella arctica TaxID=940613 RepID=UPI0021E01518|nr:alpha-amylase domain-containing protein [Granulicella arctica]